jgi:hypothetical protein
MTLQPLFFGQVLVIKIFIINKIINQKKLHITSTISKKNKTKKNKI